MKRIKMFIYKWIYGKCRHVCMFCKYRHDCIDLDGFVSDYHREKAERIRRRDRAYYKKWVQKRGGRK